MSESNKINNRQGNKLVNFEMVRFMSFIQEFKKITRIFLNICPVELKFVPKRKCKTARFDVTRI